MANEVVVREEDMKSLVRTQVWDQRGMFKTLLPKEVDVDVFAGCAASSMYKNPALAAAAMRAPESLLVALRDCARLGHQPGTDEYALTIRGGAILGIEQYQGVIHRMFNAGAVKAVHAEVVTMQERLERRDPLPPIHHVPDDDWLNRDVRVANLKGVYAYAVLDGGAISRVVVMGRAQVEAHREKAATKMIWDGPFGVSMWLKTACHELEKWVPTSASYRQERARADAALASMLGQTPQFVPSETGTPAPHTPMGAGPTGPTVVLDVPGEEEP
jgi:recombination protein RecT